MQETPLPLLRLAGTLGLAAGLIVGFPGDADADAPDKAPRLSPKRLSSVGDSITEAINAEEFSIFDPISPNPWASYANGYRGFWEWLLGRTDVNSHNQRISRNFGSRGRVNYMEGVSGADSFDLQPQMAASVSRSATYVPVLMGHNDVCQGSFADIPTDAEFEANVRAGLEELRTGLPAGATVYVQAIVDIFKLYELGSELKSLGIVDCEVVWLATLFDIYPCATMLSPAISDADRAFTRGRNIAFNGILEDLVDEYQTVDPDHYYHFTSATFDYDFVPSQVSSFDCFHPSATGQRELSRVTWESGPFSAYRR